MPFPAVPGITQPGLFTPGDPGGNAGPVLNQWPARTVNDPGLIQATVSNRDGSTLIAFIGWNEATFPYDSLVAVADDAHNFWQPIADTSAGGIIVRSAIWIASGADPCTTVSISSSMPVSSMVALIVEIPGLPSLATADFPRQVAQALSTNSETLSATATTSDWVFSMATTANNTSTITPPGGIWIPLSTVSQNDPSGAGGPADITITPMYGPATAGAVSATFGSSVAGPMAALMASIEQAPAGVINANPNWPTFKVQAAFGSLVGSGQSDFTWTDITSYVIFDDTESIIDVSRGRSYELTSPESGTIQIWLNNSTGAFTPGNPASPFYPNVLPEVPIKVTAIWNNEAYPVAYGYMDKWPQTFTEETPEWGMTNSSASDSMGILANLTLYSAYQSEVLLDQPYAYWPFGESYGTALGLPFGNIGNSLTNNKPMIGVNGFSVNDIPFSTGLTLGMQGDGGSGVGVSGLNASQPTWAAGAICVDTPATFPQINRNVTVEFWEVLPAASTLSGVSFVTPLVNLLGSPTNFGSGGGPVRFQAAAVSGTSTYKMQVSLADFNGTLFQSSSFACPSDGLLHYHAFTVSLSGSTWTITQYIDGVLDTSVTNSTVSSTNIDTFEFVVGPALITPIAANPYNYTIAHVAIYPRALNPQRIMSHFTAGSTGFLGDTALARFKRIMAWSQSRLFMAGTPPSAAPLMGAAFSVAGQAATDAFNDLLLSEGGWPYTDASGNTWWASRTSFYNKLPKWVFGDNPVIGVNSQYGANLNGGTGLLEVPYDPGTSFDFDNTYLNSQVQVTREINQTTDITTSPTQGATAQTFIDSGAIVEVASNLSQGQYGNRNALQQNVLTVSDQDAYDRAFWSLQKYANSSLRVPELLVDAASNPLLWPVVLGVEQGDIVQINRRPLGAAPYSILGIIISIHIQIGVNQGQVTLGIVPYSIEANIIQLDKTGYNTLANGIGW